MNVIKNKEGNILIPILALLLIVVFMIPITGMLITPSDDPDPLETPLYELNNLTLDYVFNDANHIGVGSYNANTLPFYTDYEGLTLEQILTDGDYFATSWALSNATGSVTSGIYSFTATAQFGYLSQTISIIVSDKYYIIARVKADSTDVKIEVNNTDVVSHSGSGNYEIISGIYTGSSTGSKVVQVQDERASGWTQVDVDWIMCIPITNTPLESETAEDISTYLGNIYWEGLNHVTDPTIETLPTDDTIGFKAHCTMRSIGTTLYDTLAYSTVWTKTNNILNYTFLESDIDAYSTSLVDIDYVQIGLDCLVGIITQNISTVGNQIKINGYGFEVLQSALNSTTNIYNFSTNSTDLLIAVNNGEYTDLADAKTSLAGTYIQYQLATPVDTTIDLIYYNVADDIYVNMTNLGINLTLTQMNYYYTLYKYYNSL